MEYRRHITRFGPLTALCVMATELEYGDHLARRITPLITGIGPVEAAVATTAALASLHQQDALPDAIISLGSAGSRNLEHAAVYQIAQVSYRDMDASALGVEKGRVPFLDLPAVVPLPAHVPGIPAASLSTGGAVISGAAYDLIEADMVDMETYAVLRAAQRYSLPLIGLRGVSDGRSELTGAHDWREYLHVVDERLAEALDLLTIHAERHGASAVINPHQGPARTDGLTRPA
ncbi:5'-methylthioadenosine/S-adenosylhomocysteine nucleosidase [Agaricicola taiwanensis]|uniref:5'-methylthioadenosine/S-adenosylhomocysteine nucleosidase n=1 Tax=Agaricicola taiwanensis TaxID=591372 RepID=A0A8J2YGU0_9RHOB|nr:5'-methylthioadenosine/S-adenosylhomocysteine nucleosidase [Agaricicola taiwanensis]GGE38064.1 5'-methylthioadenosine/S-adenosylhomocysteine nucleosidase [Agaricicola taiwanensis]